MLLIKALETAVVQIAKEDSQAAFRLSTSRQHLALDERPMEHSIWSFSQCLLAEAETLSLLKTSSTTTTNVGTPVRLKQMDAEAPQSSPQKQGTPGGAGSKSGKGQAVPMSEQPCKSSSAVKRVAKLAKGANGRTHGMEWRTRIAGVGFVEEKTTANLSARSRATTTNLLPTSQVWGEDVVVTPMVPTTTKQL